MARRSPARWALAAVTAVVLTACGGSGSDGEDAGADPAAAGAPGGDRDAGGDDSTEGNPGAPGDVAVFEEAGVPFSVLRADAETKCADGVCTLAEPQVEDGDPDDVGGVDECLIKEQSDISYDPPAEGGFFQEGATVTARVDCDPSNDHDSGEHSDDDSGGDDSGSNDSGSDDPGGDEPADDSSQG